MKKSLFIIVIIAQTILHYLGWAGVILSFIAFIFKNSSRGKELIIGGISFLVLKYIIGFIIVLIFGKDWKESKQEE